MNLPVLAAGYPWWHKIDWGLAWGVVIQAIATIIAAAAAVAAWRAAKATRDTAISGDETAKATQEATQATRDAARQARLSTLIRLHADRLGALAEVHRFVSWVTEGGRPRKELTWSERHTVVLGIPKPTTIVEGYELKGMIAATGRDLPACAEIADLMTGRTIRGAPVRRALAELHAAMADENRILGELEWDTVDQVTHRKSRVVEKITATPVD